MTKQPFALRVALSSCSLLLVSVVLFAASARCVTPVDVTVMARVTGPSSAGEMLPNPNDTARRYEVMGTDLGIAWPGADTIRVVFGDTYGKGTTGPGTGENWRSNVLAFASDDLPTAGILFTDMVTDRAHKAVELLPSQKLNNVELTVIPTGGVHIVKYDYLYSMSINHWGRNATWRTNYGGLAYSKDDCRTWTVDPAARWSNDKPGEDRFQQAALVADGGKVYLFGIPNGRAGCAYLSRVAEADLLHKDQYEYWNGTSWLRNQAASATPIVIGPVGEPSVAYNSHFQRWLMTYWNEKARAIVLRDAPAPNGPWSAEKILLPGKGFAGLYGGFIYPANSGTDLYFTISVWGKYNVFLAHATLTEDK